MLKGGDVKTEIAKEKILHAVSEADIHPLLAMLDAWYEGGEMWFLVRHLEMVQKEKHEKTLE